MDCDDCHNPHSGLDWHQTRPSFSGEEICYKCHIEIKGPFVFEHAAVRLRGCKGCHEPHGSNNPKMLVRSTMASLCLECHALSRISTNIFTSEPPAFHNLNSPTYRNCTVCHVKIHGSNSDPHLLR
jgi:DmsE family decaheme c-type cytochrome